MKLSIKASTAVLMALLSTTNAYIVTFFTSGGCEYEDFGAECGDVGRLQCCAAPDGELYVSVGQDANWGYSMQNGDSCGVILGSGDGCYSVESGIEVITGGTVVGSVPQNAAAQAQPLETVQADTWFYRNGTTKYTLPIDSEDGKKFAALKDRDDRVDFIKNVGKFSQLEE